jgi:hypothetical protein
MGAVNCENLDRAFGESDVADEARVRAFFCELEKSGSEPDGMSPESRVAGMLYADELMFCSPDSARTVKRDDLLRAVPRMTAFYRSTGMVSNRVVAVECRRLDARYLLALVRWEMRFERAGVAPSVEPIAATYVLADGEDGLRIVVQIDHQDLMQRIAAQGSATAIN